MNRFGRTVAIASPPISTILCSESEVKSGCGRGSARVAAAAAPVAGRTDRVGRVGHGLSSAGENSFGRDERRRQSAEAPLAARGNRQARRAGARRRSRATTCRRSAARRRRTPRAGSPRAASRRRCGSAGRRRAPAPCALPREQPAERVARRRVVAEPGARRRSRSRHAPSSRARRCRSSRVPSADARLGRRDLLARARRAAGRAGRSPSAARRCRPGAAARAADSAAAAPSAPRLRSGGRRQLSDENANSVSVPTPSVGRGLDHAPHRLDALAMAGAARQSAPLGPAPVAVHDDRDVQGSLQVVLVSSRVLCIAKFPRKKMC